MRVIPAKPSRIARTGEFVTRTCGVCKGKASLTRSCHRCHGLGTETGIAWHDVREYAPTTSGHAFRQLRKALGFSLGDAASALGVSVVDVSAVERGAARFEDAAGAAAELWGAQ